MQIKREVKKSANIKRKKEVEKEKDENDIDILTERFLEVKKNVTALIGKEKSENLFKDLTDVNFNEVVNKYYKNEDNKNEENGIEKINELKKYVVEYINIMDNVALIKNKK